MYHSHLKGMRTVVLVLFRLLIFVVGGCLILSVTETEVLKYLTVFVYLCTCVGFCYMYIYIFFLVFFKIYLYIYIFYFWLC